MSKALVILSGGQDSSTCLALAIQNGYKEVRAITFDYGQRHAVEVAAASRMIDELALCFSVQVEHEIVRLPRDILQGTSPLVSGAAVEEYRDAASLPGGLEKTFVPMRNMLFLTIAANRAVVMAGANIDGERASVDVYTGVSQEDYGGYPDCRERFIKAVDVAFTASLDDPELPNITLLTPLMHRSKKATVELSETLKYGRFLNAFSHTCYNGATPPCGKCHACLLRAKGYAEAGMLDPLLARLGV